MSVTARRPGLVALLVAGLITVFVGAKPASADVLKVGVLTCTIEAGVGMILGSSKALTCSYQPDQGRPELYSGRISKIGLDIGFTGRAQVVWVVLASQRGLRPGALAGDYGGVSADASVVVGVGANALIGGTGRSFVLQPLSVQGQTGLNIAAGISGLSLRRP
jgi:hypothetical protein